MFNHFAKECLLDTAHNNTESSFILKDGCSECDELVLALKNGTVYMNLDRTIKPVYSVPEK